MPFFVASMTVALAVLLVGVAKRSKRTPAAMIPAVILSLLALTTAILAGGAVMVDRWSPPRQVLSELTAL